MRSSRSTPLPRAATLAARPHTGPHTGPDTRPHTRLLARCCALALGTSLALPTLPAAAQAKPPGPAPATKPTKAQLAADQAAALQACSYDGSPVLLTPPDLSQGSGAEGASVVGEIMKYTGLPQNFDVVRGQVPLPLQGHTPREMADKRHVKMPTVRSQLASLYAKSGTRGQAELAQRVQRAAALVS